MTKAELVTNIAAQAGITKAQAEIALSTLVESVKTSVLNRKESVTIPHLGTFKYKATAARKARNPQTGAPIQVAASHKLAFKQAAELKS